MRMNEMVEGNNILRNILEYSMLIMLNTILTF